MKNKKIIVFIVILLIIIGGIILLINSKIGRNALARRDLRKITSTFYSYYYDEKNSNNDIKNFLKKYTKSGLNITLGDMEVYIEEVSDGGTKYETLEKCDRAKTKVIIYPKDPFTKTDYRLKIDLVCY